MERSNKERIGNVEKNRVWRVIKKNNEPENRRLLGAKWVFKVKKNEIFKTRLVAQGFSQISGVDCRNSFSPVIYNTTFRIILVMWIKYQWEAEIIDIETVFLYRNVDEEIYLKIPDGYKKYTSKKINENDCLILDQAIYRYVQAARQFFKKMVEVLEKKMNFVQSMNDQCLLMRNDQNRTVIVCLYIDDTLCIGDKEAINIFKKEIRKHFVLKEEGKVYDYVVCINKRINGGIFLHQSD